MDIAKTIERYYLVREKWADCSAVKTEELFGKVPQEMLKPKVRMALIEEQPDLYRELMEATIAHEQAHASLTERLTVAHERNAEIWNFAKDRT